MPIREDVTPADMQNIRQRFGYSPGVKVGNMLYIAGQVGRDTELNVVEGKEAQFAQAFENVKKVLTAAGATFDNVVEMVTYHTDMRDLQLFIEVKNRYLTSPDKLPTWTGIATHALAMPGLCVEIKCTACLE